MNAVRADGRWGGCITNVYASRGLLRDHDRSLNKRGLFVNVKGDAKLPLGENKA